MRSLAICLAACTAVTLAACGDDGTSTPTIDAASVDATAGTPTCATYCSQIQANCLDGAMNRQYVDAASCMASCAFMPVGASPDTQGNTLGCRIYHSGVAAANPTLHCPHAGPSGTGPMGPACGDACAGFCQLAMGACTGANAAYASSAACMTACAAFPTNVRYNTQVQTGNSFACKMYHATVASTTPATHCNHIKATGGPCV